MHISVKRITPSHNLLQEVIRLGKRNAKTLGFLPAGAFKEYACNQGLIIAVDSKNQLIGYLLIRLTDREVAIVHLCIDESFRRHGIASMLVEYLKTDTRDSFGIGLWCRREYDATKLWEKHGFVPLADREGRGTDHGTLVKWWYDHGHPDIFSSVAQKLHETLTPVVLDACVFFSLQDENDDLHSQACALLADWLTGIIDLRVTQEIYNDINRDTNDDRRQRRRLSIPAYLLPHSEVPFEPILKEFRNACPTKTSEQDLSDIAHLAWAVSYRVPYFVTWDSGFHDIPDTILEKHDIRIVEPSELIIHLDELMREAEYSPYRAAATYKLQFKPARANQIHSLLARFLCHRAGERKAAFKERIVSLRTKPLCQKIIVLEDFNAGAIGLLGYELKQNKIMEIKILRIHEQRLAPTVIRFLLSKAISESISQGIHILILAEKYEERNLNSAAIEMGFIIGTSRKLKILVPRICTSDNCISFLKRLAVDNQHLQMEIDVMTSGLEDARDSGDKIALSRYEHLLFPWKAEDADIPTFIVPIKPHWAHHLFDKGLAEQDLFGVNEELALNQESVYYKSPKNTGGITAPARILWYVSNEGSYLGKQSIRACSRLVEVYVDEAKSVFRRYRRLGVYSWEDAQKSSDKDGKILAMRFDDKELFSRPMNLRQIRETLPKYDCTTNFQSPRRITRECFTHVYNYCIGRRGD